MGAAEKLVWGSRCYGMKHPSEGQQQDPECFLDICKCPGTFSWLGAVELSVFWGSSTLGAFGFTSRNTLTFPQGACSHRPPSEFPCGAQWDSMGKTWVLSSLGISLPAGLGCG